MLGWNFWWPSSVMKGQRTWEWSQYTVVCYDMDGKRPGDCATGQSILEASSTLELLIYNPINSFFLSQFGWDHWSLNLGKMPIKEGGFSSRLSNSVYHTFHHSDLGLIPTLIVRWCCDFLQLLFLVLSSSLANVNGAGFECSWIPWWQYLLDTTKMTFQFGNS